MINPDFFKGKLSKTIAGFLPRPHCPYIITHAKCDLPTERVREDGGLCYKDCQDLHSGKYISIENTDTYSIVLHAFYKYGITEPIHFDGLYTKRGVRLKTNIIVSTIELSKN